MEVRDTKQTTTDGTAMADVDASADPAARVNYLDEVTKISADYKQATYKMIHLKPGDVVPDVCAMMDSTR